MGRNQGKRTDLCFDICACICHFEFAAISLIFQFLFLYLLSRTLYPYSKENGFNNKCGGYEEQEVQVRNLPWDREYLCSGDGLVNSVELEMWNDYQTGGKLLIKKTRRCDRFMLIPPDFYRIKFFYNLLKKNGVQMKEIGVTVSVW